MALITVSARGFDFDVYYECQIINDAFGTGDSPTEYEIEINSIELTDSTTDIQELLSDSIINYIEEKIIEECKYE